MYHDSGGGTFSNVEILFCHTDRTSLSTTFADNYAGNAPVQVFSSPSLSLNATPVGWHRLLFDQTFAYNGTDNLLIEIRWNGGSGILHTGATSESGWKRALLGTASATTGTLQSFRNVFLLTYFEHEISGIVLNGEGEGMAGVVLDGLPGAPVSGADGRYSASIWDGWSGSVTPRKNGHAFHPSSRIYGETAASATGQDYDGMPTLAASATHEAGDIPTDHYFMTLPGEACCPARLTVTVPDNAVIFGVDVAYAMTAANMGWMSEQRSWLRCVSPGGVDEPDMAMGHGNSGGTFVYERTGLTIANGVVGGELEFELHAGRTWGYGFQNEGDCDLICNTYYNKVDAGTWTVTVHYLEAVEPDLMIHGVAVGADGVAIGFDRSDWTPADIAVEESDCPGGPFEPLDAESALRFGQNAGTVTVPATEARRRFFRLRRSASP